MLLHRGECLRVLREICGHQSLLPTSFLIQPSPTPSRVLNRGRYADLRKELYKGCYVATKTVNIVENADGLKKVCPRSLMKCLYWPTDAD